LFCLAEKNYLEIILFLKIAQSAERKEGDVELQFLAPFNCANFNIYRAKRKFDLLQDLYNETYNELLMLDYLRTTQQSSAKDMDIKDSKHENQQRRAETECRSKLMQATESFNRHSKKLQDSIRDHLRDSIEHLELAKKCILSDTILVQQCLDLLQQGQYFFPFSFLLPFISLITHVLSLLYLFAAHNRKERLATFIQTPIVKNSVGIFSGLECTVC
jgi:hypothetical protein